MKTFFEFIDINFALQNVIEPLSAAGFNVKLIGSVQTKGGSEKDIDILLTIKHESEFSKFEAFMKASGWAFQHSDENPDHPEWGIFHNYEKEIDSRLIGVDVFVD